nr:hypothetical protein CFP56_28756 [Quercus suber]
METTCFSSLSWPLIITTPPIEMRDVAGGDGVKTSKLQSPAQESSIFASIVARLPRDRQRRVWDPDQQ